MCPLWYLNLYCPIHNIPLLHTILSQLNPVLTLSQLFVRLIFLPYMFTPSCQPCILSGFPAERLRVFPTFLVVFHMSLICMSIRIVTKSVYYLRYGRLSVRPFALSAGIQLGGFPWNLILDTFMKILEKVQNWLKSDKKLDKNIGHFTWKSKHVLFIFLRRHWIAIKALSSTETVSGWLSVCPHVGLSARCPTWRIYVKFDFGDFYENI
jgi:hypothetical protein